MSNYRNDPLFEWKQLLEKTGDDFSRNLVMLIRKSLEESSESPIDFDPVLNYLCNEVKNPSSISSEEAKADRQYRAANAAWGVLPLLPDLTEEEYNYKKAKQKNIQNLFVQLASDVTNPVLGSYCKNAILSEIKDTNLHTSLPILNLN